MRGEKDDVQLKVREHFKNAHYVHCYVHQLTLIRRQVTSHMPAVRGFFPSLFSLFTQSPKHTSILNQIVARRPARASSTRWNSSSRIVSAVYEDLDDLIQCFESIRTSGSFGSATLREASGFLKMLRDRDLKFFLCCFIKSSLMLTSCTSSCRGRTLMQPSLNESCRASQIVTSNNVDQFFSS